MGNICFAADLHVDNNDDNIDWKSYPAEVIIVCGDISNNSALSAKTVNGLLDYYPEVLVVDGNHEHYGNASAGISVDRNMENFHGNLDSRVKYLPKTGPVKIGDIWFIGVNGWYSFDFAGDPMHNRAKYMAKDSEMNDNFNIGFAAIGQMMPWDRAELDAATMTNWVNDIIRDEPDATIIGVTHTAPIRQSLGLEPKNLMKNAFYANLWMQEVVEHPNVIAWAHGHTHQRSMKYHSGKPIVVNPRGTKFESNDNWEPVVLEF